MNLETIMKKYNSQEATLEETNEALKDYGIYLDPDKNPDGGWTAAEIAEGFFPGKPAQELASLEDFRKRNAALAGHTIIVKVKEGNFRVSYHDDGYYAGSVRV